MSSIQIQRLFVPIGKLQSDGVSVTMTDEHRRPLEQMANLINAQQAAIATLQARLAAAGIP